MFNIVIVGAGQLGSRHLQGLSKVDFEINLYVVDPNDSSLELSKSRFNEMPKNPNILVIKYLNNIKNIPGEIDLCIISCSSDVRRAVFENLISKVNLRYIFKVSIFQQINESDNSRNYTTKNYSNNAKKLKTY